jgi:hypothetical protein
MRYHLAFIRRLERLFRSRRQPHALHKRLLGLEELEDRTAPSATPTLPDATQLALYQGLTSLANDIAVSLQPVVQSAIAGSQSLDQLIGVPFLQSVAGKVEADLAALAKLDIPGASTALFGASGDADFADKACDFLRACVRLKVFPRCASDVVDNSVCITPAIPCGIIPNNLAGTVVYATACANICDCVYTCEIAPCVHSLCCDLYDCDSLVFDDADLPGLCDPTEIQVTPLIQVEQQAIEGCIADPTAEPPVSQTQSFQLDGADNSPAAAVTFTLTSAGQVENATFAVYAAGGVAMTTGVCDYANTGLASSETLNVLATNGAMTYSFDTLNLQDGTALTVESLFGANGTVAGQVAGFYNADGSLNSSVTITDTEAGNGSLSTDVGLVTAADGTIVDAFAVSNLENAAGDLTASTVSITDSTDGTDVSATGSYDPGSDGVTDVTATSYVDGTDTGSTAIDGSGDPIDTGGDSGGYTGGDTGDNSGGYTGGDTGGNTGGYTGGETDGGAGFADAQVMRPSQPAGIYVQQGALSLGSNTPARPASAASHSPYAGIIAAFTGTDPNPADYSALIFWSDGSASAGMVSSAAKDQFNLFAAHQKAAGVQPTFVSITDVANGAHSTLVVGGQAASLPYGDTFDGNQLGPTWLTETGGFTVSHNHATGVNATAGDLAVLNGVTASDVQVQANVSFTATGQNAGLVVRYAGSGTGSFYEGMLVNLGHGMVQSRIYRSINGKLTQIGTSQKFASHGGTMSFLAQGSSLKLFLNGNMVATAQDAHLTTGSAGMRTSAGANLANFQAAAAPPINVTLPFTDAFTGSGLSLAWNDLAGGFAVANNQATGLNNSAPNLAILNGASAADVTLQARVSLTAAQQSAALVARYSAAHGSSMYFGLVQSLGHGKYRAAIYRVVKGVPKLLAAKTILTFAGAMQFQLTGNKLSLSLDGKVVLSLSDRSISAAGSVGMQATAGAAFQSFSATV